VEGWTPRDRAAKRSLQGCPLNEERRAALVAQRAPGALTEIFIRVD
jgi:hypothetical protein